MLPDVLTRRSVVRLVRIARRRCLAAPRAAALPAASRAGRGGRSACAPLRGGVFTRPRSNWWSVLPLVESSCTLPCQSLHTAARALVGAPAALLRWARPRAGAHADHCWTRATSHNVNDCLLTAQVAGCRTIPSYGPRGGRPRACRPHASGGWVPLLGYWCKHPEGCARRATFGVPAAGAAPPASRGERQWCAVAASRRGVAAAAQASPASSRAVRQELPCLRGGTRQQPCSDPVQTQWACSTS